MELIGVFDKFPDTMEVYRENEDNPKPVLKFVVFRKNSRSFTTDQRQALDFMVDAGLSVVVRVGNIEMTLDEFDRGGAYSIAPGRLLAQSTYYSKQAELRRLERVLDSMPADAPERFEFGKRIQHLKTMLGLSDQTSTSHEQLRKSDEGLKRLEQMIGKPNPHELTDDFLRATTYKILSDMYGIGTPDHHIGVARKALLDATDRVVQLNAELTLQPDNLDLRAQLIDEEKRVGQLGQQLERMTNNATQTRTTDDGTGSTNR